MKTSVALLLSLLLVHPLFAQSLSQGVASPTHYFQQREKAIALTRKSEWEKASALLNGLLEQYQHDSDMFYLQGICAYETGKYQEAIHAFRKCLAKGGASLREIPTASSPSNDIMVKIAMAYGKLGDKANAISWLKKAFDARYDEKPFLMGHPAFEAFSSDEAFLALFGMSSQKDLSREEAWKSDLDFLEKQVYQMSYAVKHGELDKAGIAKSIASVKSNISSLSDEEIVVEIMKIVGSFKHGHNLVIPTTAQYGALKKLPIQFYQFSDGVFIVNANEAYKEWIGYKVEAIGNMTVEEVVQKTNAVNSRDNDMQTLWLGPYYMALPDVLKGLGIIENAEKLSLSLNDQKGNTKKLELSPEKWDFADFPKMPKLSGNKQPLFLAQIDTLYWSQALPEQQAMYIQFNAVANKEHETLKMFCEAWYAKSQEQQLKNVILDLRHNHGGDGSIMSSIHQAIRKFKMANPEGRIFVLAGRETFSAAQNLLTALSQYADPIIVGEPSGSSPNFVGEAGWVRLPNSGLMAIISSQYHQNSFAEDHRKWIAPHMPVSLSSTDYFAGKDPALEAIKKLIQGLDAK